MVLWLLTCCGYWRVGVIAVIAVFLWMHLWVIGVSLGWIQNIRWHLRGPGVTGSPGDALSEDSGKDHHGAQCRAGTLERDNGVVNYPAKAQGVTKSNVVLG